MAALQPDTALDPASSTVPYTKNIVLEEVTLEEFEGMEQFWGKHISKKAGEVYCRIQQPLQETEYVPLLQNLCSLPWPVRISANNHGRWVRIHNSWATPEHLEKLAAIAAADERKRYFLEAKIQKYNYEYQEWWTRVIIEFREYDQRIVGNDMRIHWDYREICTIRAQRDSWRSALGLWVP